MNKWKILLFINAFFLFCPMVLGEESKENIVELQCSPVVMKGSNVVCNVMLNNPSDTVEAIQFHYEFSDKISYVKTFFDSNCEELVSNSSGLNAVIKNVNLEQVNIAQINFIVSERASVGEILEIKLNNIQLADNDKTVFSKDLVAKVEVLSIQDIVTELSVNGNPIEIRDNIFNYIVDVDADVESVVVGAKIQDDDYQFVSGYGPRTISELKAGKNEVQLKIVSKKNNLPVAVYRIVIHKNGEANLSVEGNEENVGESPKIGNYFYIIIGLLILGGVIFVLKYKRKIGGLK